MTGPHLSVLVDASSLIYRAFFSVPETLRAPDGRQMNAAHGFIDMIARLVERFRPQAFACAWDDDWRPQWRVDLIESYKTHRVATDADPVADALEPQMGIIAEALDLTGVATAGAEGYEAEDVIGVLAARAPGQVAIVSGDRDLFQLVRDPDVWVLYPKRGVTDLAHIDEAEIARRYGIPGRAYADFAILRGDPSDGLPGVRGIGEKTAAALIAAHGDLAGVVAAASQPGASGALAKVAASLDYIARAERVVRITTDAPVGDIDVSTGALLPAPSLDDFADFNGIGGPVARLKRALGSVG